MSQEETQGLPETQLSLVQTQKQGPFPDLPNGTGRGEMTSKPPGQFKGDGKGNPQTESDSPDNYTGPLKPVYEFKLMVKAWYITDSIQLVVAGVIFLNFILVMFSVTQFVLDNKDIEDICDDLDTVFITFFLIELAVNMLTSAQGVGEASIMSPLVWRWEFWVGENWSWNWFDFIVIVTPVALEGASWASSIRILRLFRVIRVLKSIAKFEALQVVASSVSRSMSGVGATAIFILITVCMYAIIGVEMFGKVAEGSCAPTDDTDCLGNPDLSGVKYTAMSWQQRRTYANENCDGVPLWQYFGNLRRSMLTMFVFTTVEGWPDIGWCLGKTYPGGSAFCTSFIIITALLMANIVVAIFTNKMEEAQEEVEKEQEELRKQRQASIAKWSKDGTALENAQGVDLDGDGIADEFGVDIDGDGVVDAVITAEEMAQATGASGRIENMGDLANILKDFQAKLDSIASKVDTLMSEKSQKS